MASCLGPKIQLMYTGNNATLFGAEIAFPYPKYTGSWSQDGGRRIFESSFHLIWQCSAEDNFG